MNTKFLNKNELKYYKDLLKDIKIIKKVDNELEKQKIKNNDEITIEDKEFLIKNIDERNKKVNKIENIDDDFKKNMLDIMTLADYNNIKNDDFFNTYNKNLININFERIKNYIKTKYITLNIEEFIPIVNYILEKKDLIKTDNLKNKIILEEKKIINEITKIIKFFEIKKSELKKVYNEDINKSYYKDYVKKEFLKLYNKYDNKNDEKIEKINNLKNLVDLKIDNLKNIGKNIDEEEIGENIEDLKKLYIKINNLEMTDYVNEYNNEKKIIIENVASKKIQNMLKKVIFRKNLVINKIEKNKQIDEEIKIMNKNNLNNIYNNIIENIINDDEETSAIKIDNLNKDLDKVENDLEDLSTEAQTMIDKGEKKDQYIQTQNEEKLANLKNNINIYRNIVIDKIKNDKEAYNMFLSFYNKFFDDIINNINTYSKAKTLIENLYVKKINKNAVKYTIQLRDILINDFPILTKKDFP